MTGRGRPARVAQPLVGVSIALDVVGCGRDAAESSSPDRLDTRTSRHVVRSDLLIDEGPAELPRPRTPGRYRMAEKRPRIGTPGRCGRAGRDTFRLGPAQNAPGSRRPISGQSPVRQPITRILAGPVPGRHRSPVSHVLGTAATRDPVTATVAGASTLTTTGQSTSYSLASRANSVKASSSTPPVQWISTDASVPPTSSRADTLMCPLRS